MLCKRRMIAEPAMPLWPATNTRFPTRSKRAEPRSGWMSIGDVVDTGLGLAHTGPRTFLVTGRTHSKDFPTTAGAFDTTFNGQFDVFLAILRT